jgi:plasmid replication initiation protein
MNTLSDFYAVPRNKTIRKSNDLIQKNRFDLSLQQQKIILFLISQINPSDEDFKVYEFNIIDFCKICGIDYTSGKNYEDLKEQIKKIADKSMWIKKDDNSESLVRWIEKPTIKEKSGIIQLKLDEDLKPYLIHLKRNFTQYDIIYTLCFKSKYSIRLYELIKSIHYNELHGYTKEYSLDEIKILLGAENYKTYQHLKERVLIPSINEINNTSDKQISYTPIKKGKSVVGIVLNIETKDLMDRINARTQAEHILDNQLSLFDGE